MTHEGAFYLQSIGRVGKDVALKIMMASGMVPVLTDMEVAMFEKMRCAHVPVIMSKDRSVCAMAPPFDAGEAIAKIVAARLPEPEGA